MDTADKGECDYMKKRRKLMRTIYLDVEQIERLRKLSAKTRVPQAVYIRDGLDLVLNIHSEKIRKKKVKHRVKHSKRTSLRLLKR